ncbi:ribbon-helix-helix domain-containing protein [Gelidibacter japonicus]|jgi:predicted transcriptional regulator|uniref:ribbon-helix-helix domain-containing protein n=1 Tax=Gelidibacter japonicus TaxID=1962232 RepID=UPI0013D75B90|nr:ribbon-helix-helix domain-containing protein [Gelidibacter japonicus]MCL8009008.1 ribbon-helix-helix domain-containing protein [Gelidibacter japonicus]
MATFTSSLPDELLKELADTAKKLKLPKNKIIEKALEYYLDQIKRAEYAKSFQRAAKDPEMLLIAEEGLEDYVRILEDLEKK